MSDPKLLGTLVPKLTILGHPAQAGSPALFHSFKGHILKMSRDNGDVKNECLEFVFWNLFVICILRFGILN